MTIENSEETANSGVPDPAAATPGLEPSSGSTESAQERAPRSDSASPIEAARTSGAQDSTPPLGRKLAPPPKPKRDSGAASAPPSARPAEGPELQASPGALKAPTAPNITFTGDGVPTLAEAPAAVAPLSQPPPLRRRSQPSFPDVAGGNASSNGRVASEPALSANDITAKEAAAKEAAAWDAPAPNEAVSKDATAQDSSSSARPMAAPPRPRSDPPSPPRPRTDSAPSVPNSSAPPAPASNPPGFPTPSTPPSAIFAMRIIAVGDSARPPATQEPTPDIDPDSYPPSGSRLGTTVRRSSRPGPAAASAPAPAPVPLAVPPAPPLPSDLGPTIELDVPIEVELPAASAAPAVDRLAALDAAAAALEASSADAPSAPNAARRPPAPPPPVELAGDQFSAESIAKRIAAAEALEAAEAARAAPNSAAEAARAAPSSAEAPASDDAAEELGREDATSIPPEEVAVEDAAKPPPPPKRAAVAAAAAAAASGAGAAPAASPAAEPTSAPAPTPREPPPTPDLAAAKAAQRAKTRQPWWEDLFNEDFMRASSRVSDEHIRREVTFIEESLGVAAGGVVLDLGCGSGHHAVEFASRGYGVVGYDLSLYQLALAADVAQERGQKINFLQGDMREMAFEEMFDGVFCWNTSFGYFEEDKNLAVAQRVFKALRPGGMFLVDVINRDFAAASAPCTVWYEGDSCVCMDDMSVDYISSRLRVKRSIILDDGRTKESLFSLRLYSLHELGKLLHEVGFRVTEASGHPATPGVFFGPNSPRIIMLAQRP
ncbi:MAG TPA: methyltransferase domain-containing protein [Polyangiaceae bacterium]|nr:methyltransferase domain-containing protein [Polyangiaceae bacterium]